MTRTDGHFPHRWSNQRRFKGFGVHTSLWGMALATFGYRHRMLHGSYSFWNRNGCEPTGARRKKQGGHKHLCFYKPATMPLFAHTMGPLQQKKRGGEHISLQINVKVLHDSIQLPMPLFSNMCKVTLICPLCPLNLESVHSHAEVFFKRIRKTRTDPGLLGCNVP